MSPRTLVVIAGGEHARVVIEAAQSRATEHRLLGFIDPEPCEETARRLGVSWLGHDDVIPDHADSDFVLGFGQVDAGRSRRNYIGKLASRGLSWRAVIHERAWVSPTAYVGAGAVILAGAVVNSGARIGEHCIVNTNATIEHDVVLEDFVVVAPGSAIGGGASIGEGSFIGLGALIRDHHRVGRDCVVGMGAVVTQDFGDGMVVLGAPAIARSRKGRA